MIDPNRPVGMPPATEPKPAAKPAGEPATRAEAPASLTITDSTAKAGPAPSAATSVSLFADPAPASQPLPDLGTGKAADKTDRPWKLENLNFRYGLIFSNSYARSDIHVKDPVNGTDMTIHDVKGRQRTSAHYLYSMPNGHPQPDEPQSEIALSGRFQNKWGFEVNVKHHKYVVMTGEDADQQVRMSGTLNGAPVDEVRSLRDYLPEYQITNGLNQISLMATRSFQLPHPKKDDLTYNVKAGPSVMMPFVKSTVVNKDGTTTRQSGPYQFGAGFGGQIEHSIRYDFRKRVSLELTQGISGMTVKNGSFPNGGTANQTVWAHSLALTLGYSIGKNWGKKD